MQITERESSRPPDVPEQPKHASASTKAGAMRYRTEEGSMKATTLVLACSVFGASPNVSLAEDRPRVVSPDRCATLRGTVDPFMVVLKRGDDVLASLSTCLEEARVMGASIVGLGAIEDPVLGFYDLAKKRFLRRKFKGIYEVLGIVGNLATSDDGSVTHVHITLGKRNFQVIGGHLFSGRVGVTLELTITPLGQMPVRALDPDIGLKLIEPSRTEP